MGPVVMGPVVRDPLVRGRAGLRPAADAAGRPVGVVHLTWYSSQDAGVRCKSVYSMYGEFGTGSMYWLDCVGQPV
jgi:hypothetical protein